MTNKATRNRLRDLRTDVEISFRTADGFTLGYNKQTREFTDGDMTWDVNAEGWPVTSDDEPLDGTLRRHHYESDRTIYLDHHGIRIVVQGFGAGEAWQKYIAVPRALVEAWKDERRAEGYDDEYLTDMAYVENVGLVCSEHYGGPGQAFTRHPAVSSLSNDRYVIAMQAGGLDI